MDLTSIWNTAECSAWSRDFDYDNYLMLHATWPTKSRPVDVSTYAMLRRAFDNQMSLDFSTAPTRDL